jgi:hypothetical protein
MRVPLLVPALLAGLVLTGCSGSSGDKSAGASATAPADVAAATSDIKKAWADFFSGTAPLAEKAKLLEGAASLTQVIALAAKDPNAKSTTAAVTAVTFTDPDHAAVKYDLFVSGAKALSGADGKAVREGGTWKVSKFTFCGLMNLKAGATVPGC